VRAFVVGLALVLSLARPVSAKGGKFPPPTLSVVLWSARSCYAEATWSKPDCAALLHVIRKRTAGTSWSFLRMLEEYSVRNWVQSQHGQRALDLELGTNPLHSPAWNRRWQQLVKYVVNVLRDRAVDPCPEANHWAAQYYQPRSPMARVVCEVETLNAFWLEAR
jgi:hypothetical protein